MKNALSVRIDADNLNHHLWDNNGTWWCHYTVHPTEHTKRRERVSLRTHNIDQARVRRDALFASLSPVPTPVSIIDGSPRCTAQS